MCDHCGCRSFPPIAELTADHELILGLAWCLAESARVGTGQDASSRSELVALLDAHVAKEESGLYPALVAVGGVSAEQVADLEEEHRELRLRLTADTFDRRDFYALAAHIEVEELELFPTAMLGFDEEEWDVTGHAHRAVDDAPLPPAK
jgi:hemerythrin HHE cation binding domain-containing protein